MGVGPCLERFLIGIPVGGLDDPQVPFVLLDALLPTQRLGDGRSPTGRVAGGYLGVEVVDLLVGESNGDLGTHTGENTIVGCSSDEIVGVCCTAGHVVDAGVHQAEGVHEGSSLWRILSA